MHSTCGAAQLGHARASPATLRTLCATLPPTPVSPLFHPCCAGAEQGGYIAWYEIKALIAKGAKVGWAGAGPQRLGNQERACCLFGCAGMTARASQQPGSASVRAPCLQVVIDQTAKAAAVIDGTNWIGTDVPETINMKIDAARQRGLGGLMVRLQPGALRAPGRHSLNLRLCIWTLENALEPWAATPTPVCQQLSLAAVVAQPSAPAAPCRAPAPCCRCGLWIWMTLRTRS